MTDNMLRSPIVTICGHVDHGKTTILDALRGSFVQEGEAGGITQKISFTKYPIEKIESSCPLIGSSGVKLEIPGFLFIDTPGHAAFVNLRKRGGALADLAVVVVSIKEGIKPQTQEVLQILKSHKTPFVIALNKIDTISGWKKTNSLRNSVESQASNVREEFEEALLIFQSSLKENGFDSALCYDIADFTKQVAIVPCSGKTGEGISELLFVLCGLCQKFLKERLKVSDEAKGVILEMKKEKGIELFETILYDGVLKENDEIVIASFGEPVVSKVRSIGEIMPLSLKFQAVESVRAAAGARIQLTNKEGVMAGMPFQKFRTKAELEKAKLQFRKEIFGILSLDNEGIIIKADSLGSLEALIMLLRQEKIKIVRAGIGDISKSDIVSAKANFEINPLDALVVGFNVGFEEDMKVPDSVKMITNEVVYKLIEDIQEWRKKRENEIIKEKLMGLATIAKLEVLHNYVFRNSNPAIFGVRVLAGKIKLRIPLIDENGLEVARVKSLQEDKVGVLEAGEGKELAICLPGIAFDRRMKDVNYLYSDISESQFKEFKKHKELLSQNELRILEEVSNIKAMKK